MEAMNKDQAKNTKDQGDASKKEKNDKRNLNLKKEGLLNEEAWIHKNPKPTEKIIQ